MNYLDKIDLLQQIKCEKIIKTLFKSLTLRQKYGIKLWFNTVFFYILSRFQNLFSNSYFCYRGLTLIFTLIGRWWSG